MVWGKKSDVQGSEVESGVFEVEVREVERFVQEAHHHLRVDQEG